MKPVTIKLDNGDEAIAMRDGKPLFTDDSGKEVAFDVAHTTSTISRLNAESKTHREAKEAAEKQLKNFEGIEDPAEAIKALTTVKNLDSKQLIDAGKVEEIKNEAIKAVEDKYKPVIEENQTLKTTLNNEMIGGRFARSTFINEKIAVPADFVEARFGKNFSIKDGKVVAVDNNGNPVYSKERPGETADFDEALEILVEAYPQKDHILKGDGQRGSGSKGSGTGTGQGKMSRAEFDALAARDPAGASQLMAEGKTEVVD